jgi:hypothetical protein
VVTGRVDWLGRGRASAVIRVGKVLGEGGFQGRPQRPVNNLTGLRGRMQTHGYKGRKPLPHMVKTCSRFFPSSVHVTRRSLASKLRHNRSCAGGDPTAGSASERASARRAHQLRWLRLTSAASPVSVGAGPELLRQWKEGGSPDQWRVAVPHPMQVSEGDGEWLMRGLSEI